MSAAMTRRTPARARVTALLSLVCLTMVFAPTATSEAQDGGAPPWGEFLRRFNRDRLLKPPFANAEEETPKGLASKIRARELDVPNRIKAVKYLSTLDCRQFPEAKEMLITVMQEDKWEEVRYAAAVGLRDMLDRHSCKDQNGGDVWSQCKQYCSNAANKVSRRETRRQQQEGDCHCKNCCDEDTLNALAKTAYEMDDNGCPVEPSLRVREMAVEAIQACGIKCNYAPYYASEISPAPAKEEEMFDPERVQETPQLEQTPEGNAPEVPQPPQPEEENREAKLPPLPRVTATQPAVKTEVAPTPIAQLDKICIVAWRHGQTVAPKKEFESVYKGRIYYFSNAEFKAEFDAAPEVFSVAYGGCDPVHFVKTREPLVGRYLADCDGRFYLFATLENLEEFNTNLEVYTRGQKRTIRVASATE